MSASSFDRAMMRAALGYARRGLGTVAPNPTVACVLVKDARVLARGRTGPGGRPHGERVALERAAAEARGATAYVTFEPCAHHGQTPPCAEALVAAGVKRVVSTICDPDPRVASRGFARLREAGLEVVEGVEAEAAAELNLGFITRARLGRPAVIVKLATTLDGRIATARGESRWITGPLARAEAHALRSECDAILIGRETAVADDPALTVRLEGLEGRRPVRIVADTLARLPMSLALVQTAREHPTWLLVGAEASEARLAPLRGAGVRILRIEKGVDGRLDLAAALCLLGGEGLTRVLVEGGGALAGALIASQLADRIVWMRSPSVLGADARASVGALGIESLAGLRRFRRLSVRPVGDDSVETYAAADTEAETRN